METILKLQTSSEPNFKKKIPPGEIDEEFIDKNYHQRNVDLESLSSWARLLPKLFVSNSWKWKKNVDMERQNHGPPPS
jgi:hypothetical protein